MNGGNRALIKAVFKAHELPPEFLEGQTVGETFRVVIEVMHVALLKVLHGLPLNVIVSHQTEFTKSPSSLQCIYPAVL